MSLSLSLLQNSYNAQLLSTIAPNTSDPTSIAAITTASLTKSSSTLTGLGSDLAGVLKSLASKDTAAAQSGLAQLQKDLGVSSSSSASTSSSPLQQLFSSVSSSISSGDTTGAIHSLASFFLQNGSSTTGNVVDATA